MSKRLNDTDCKSVLDPMLLNLPGVVGGKMFGHSAYYVYGRLFACIYGDGVGIKVPQATASKLLLEKHIGPFQPYGKPRMREWIHIVHARPEDYRRDIGIFHDSIDFVSQIRATKRTK
jgi:hypothetical protein